ncbi:DNA photolyase [Artaxa digramma nucleopolyhedrovirus]|uniref:Deoxyribodipyrimidine photo-lyase n=1 Tax=Artaxa digramma nucleopolyhedrovirus TaxID=3070910 RepID=A0AAE6R6S2_9ABAC|nr:DNA photolyase [Euproctis digramma nucleopolyhedrovirus]QHB21679.1 DNA photolyase [Artaxa digramma nucleopolyhedrovirus]
MSQNKRFKANLLVVVNNLKSEFEECRVTRDAETLFDTRRVRVINNCAEPVSGIGGGGGGVVYWMSRDSRVQDNWALVYAQRLAIQLNTPLYVVFCLTKSFLQASMRQFHFLLEGLKLVRDECRSLNIGFVMLDGSGDLVLADWVRRHGIAAVVCDFNPLRVVKGWVTEVARQLPDEVYFAQVDAHNVVPCWLASSKQEYSARTFRLKFNKLLSEFLTPYPAVARHKIDPALSATCADIEWTNLLRSRNADADVGPVRWARAGYVNALAVLADFINTKLSKYGGTRNDPNADSQSNLSPWYHFGQISVQRVVWYLRHGAIAPLVVSADVEAYIEECLVRRELADNFCFYNENYDNINGAPNWARVTLEQHANDVRQYVYDRKQLDEARTHDSLWNAAQAQLRTEGKMHGYMRMYWAKKILEWSASPAAALSDAIYFNDRYNVDGRDPNGYVGCMWSICGVHDQGWKERSVFGKIRYMNYEGCVRKFDVQRYVAKYINVTL